MQLTVILLPGTTNGRQRSPGYLFQNYAGPEAICGWSGPAWCRWWSHQEFACEVRHKILDLAIFSCQEGTLASNWELPLLCSLSLAVLNISLMRAHLCTYPTRFYYSSSVWEWDHTKVERIIMSQLRLVQPWPDQPDQFRCLCYENRFTSVDLKTPFL